uniref:FERM and PDZ domain containing 1b n=1 Tax=Oncorhynchus kisutch TaxID=8019 RepID=A0A8C7K7X2_ONCKI
PVGHMGYINTTSRSHRVHKHNQQVTWVRETERSLGVLEINIYLESFISNDLLYTLLIKMMRKRILCVCVWVAGPADGRLIPGDQVVKINNVAVDDLTPEQAADLIRECQHSVMITVLRNSGPKSSFITPEKRAKLRSNPVKVRFAEEVEVNSHSQGNSLLFLPNVLKVYLENGQTKAFKFEPNTTVKDIVMTLKEKLSLSRIEHFSLVLEQKYSISKLLLLHEEERIQQVVHQKEVHDYRCLFRVCFIPREPEHLLQDDPTAFQYLYLQGINDVLQERFAVEMRCNTALRLAALHIQERLASCGQSPRTKLKIITKSWGIENFISSTLLRNMREKDLRKAIGYHMKKSQSQEPKQKVLSANQAKINYLEELCDLKSFGGKSFSATMMLQDRESMVTLLVGSRYGISQVVNHKLSIMTTLTEFSSITRIELLPESDRVSLVKIYLQDIKPITLLLESVAAKELSCLVAGYCRALVDPSLIIFPWTQDGKQHRVSAEEGGERKGEEERGGGERKEEEERGGGERKGEEERGGGEVRGAMTEEHRSVSEEASDSCRTDSRFMTSISSDSLDALEEDDLIACSSSLPHPHPPFRLTVEPPHPQPHPREGASSPQGRAGEWRGEGGGGGSGEWRGGGGECRGGGGDSPPASQPSSSALALPLTTSPPLSSFLSSSPPSSLLSPSFPRSVLPPSSSMELSPLLSPLLSPSNCFLSQSSLHDDISRLRHRRFPPPPAGFQNVRSDVDELLTLLQGGRMGSRGGRHPRETCATHFSENKRLLHGEARRLMAGCQKVVRVGQTPDEMLFSLSDSFRTLVGMAGMCLWFSGCDRCDRRNAEALAGLADVARTYREFVLAAERASGRRSCHDLSTKLLAKQCTALTASVFCLTQLFRTLTAL